MGRWPAVVLWAGLVAVGFGLAPPSRPDQTAWILDLLSGRWAGQNPALVSLFQLMGLWPALLATLVLDPSRRGRLPAWPFVLASFALGTYVLLPWFFLPFGSGPLPRTSVVRIAVAALVGLVAAGFVAWGSVAGDLPALVESARTDGFVWAMAVDFVGFTALSVAVARDLDDSRLPWAVTAVPLFGTVAWAVGRRR